MEHNYLIWTQQKWDFLMKGEIVFSLWAVIYAPSVVICHFKDHTKGIYPDGHIFFGFWQRINVGHCCWPSMMVSMLWVVVIYHIISLMIRVSFFNFDWSQILIIWYSLQPSWLFIYEDFYYFLFSFQSNTAFIVGYMNSTKFHFFYKKVIYSLIMSFFVRFIAVSLFAIISIALLPRTNN